MLLFLLCLHFLSFHSFFPIPFFHLLYYLFYLFSPFSERWHKMTHKGWRVVKPHHNQYLYNDQSVPLYPPILFCIDSPILTVQNRLYSLKKWHHPCDSNMVARREAVYNCRGIPGEEGGGGSTWRLYNVALTSMQRHGIASTLTRRCINVMCPLGYITRERA